MRETAMFIVMIGQKGLPSRSGGIERHVEILAKELANRGHHVVVFGRFWYVEPQRFHKGKEDVAGGEVEYRKTWGIHTKHLDAISHSLTALLCASRMRPEIIHIHGMGNALLVPMARILCPKAKVIVTFHCLDQNLSKWNSFVKQLFRLGERVACRWAHGVIVVSQELMHYCLERYAFQPTYVPHPLPAMAVTSDEPVLHAGLQSEKYLLFVGRLVEDKNAHVLIRAFREARNMRPELFRSITLAIVGKWEDHDCYGYELCKLAISTPSVRLLGEVTGEQLSAFQAFALAHVFPTQSEGLSYALLEAGASGHPIVMTDLPQNREVTGGNSIEISSRDEMRLSIALIRVMEMTKEEQQNMGSLAQQHVQKKFSLITCVDEVERVYRTQVTKENVLVTPLVCAKTTL